jgi:hypothetical protein
LEAIAKIAEIAKVAEIAIAGSGVHVCLAKMRASYIQKLIANG